MPNTTPCLLHVLPTFDLGGAQRRIVDLMNASAREQRHIVLAIDGGRGATSRVRPNVDLTFTDIPVRPSGGLALDNLTRLRGLLREHQPDLLLTYNFGALEAALANRLWPFCRHIHLEDGFGPEEADGRQLARRVWARRLALSGGHTTLMVPSLTLQRIALEQWRFKDSRVRYIPNGIDIDRFAQAKPLANLRQRDDEVLIGTVGVLRPEKRLDRLLRVFAQLDPAKLDRTAPLRLVIAGDGAERPRLEALAAELGINPRVTFTGFVDRTETVLAAFDIFALTSDTEQMPYSLIEAMAAGLPVVATDVGDVRQMLPAAHRDDVLARDDEKGLTARLAALVASPERRRDEGKIMANHAAVQYGIEVMIERYRTLFDLVNPQPANSQNMAVT